MDEVRSRQIEAFVIGVILIGLIVLVIGSRLGAAGAQKAAQVVLMTRPAGGNPPIPPPTYPAYPPPNGNTATPNRETVAANVARSAGTVYPTPTPLVISKETDLSPELPDQEKFIVIVARADGTNEKFTIGPVSNYPSSRSFYYSADDIQQLLPRFNLQPGDKITSIYPIAWIGMVGRPTAPASIASPIDKEPTTAPMPIYPAPGVAYP
jgi:hypothetical protein